MKNIIYIVIGFALSFSSHAGVFKTTDSQGNKSNAQVIVVSDKKAKIVNSDTGEIKSVKGKEVQSGNTGGK